MSTKIGCKAILALGGKLTNLHRPVGKGCQETESIMTAKRRPSSTLGTPAAWSTKCRPAEAARLGRPSRGSARRRFMPRCFRSQPDPWDCRGQLGGRACAPSTWACARGGSLFPCHPLRCSTRGKAPKVAGHQNLTGEKTKPLLHAQHVTDHSDTMRRSPSIGCSSNGRALASMREAVGSIPSSSSFFCRCCCRPSCLVGAVRLFPSFCRIALAAGHWRPTCPPPDRCLCLCLSLV